MRAAILAGGKGTRIAAQYPDIPKPMIPLCGRPVLEQQIRQLATQGIRDITLIVGYKADVIQKYFGDGKSFDVNISYIVENSPLGTGGALPLLPQEDTLLLLGDVYCEVDFRRFVEFYHRVQAGITLFVHPNSHPYDSDIVVLGDNGKVLAWKSKNDSCRGELRNLVNAGFYIFRADELPKGDTVRCDLERDIITPRIKYGQVYGYRSAEWVKDMGTPDRLAQAENEIQRGIVAARSMRYQQKAIFFERDGTIIASDGYITKPEQVRLLDGAAEAIKQINQSEYLAICITNQPVIARGDVTLEGLEAIHARLDTLLGEQGAYLDDLFFCPHHPDKGFKGERPEYKIDCDCRKPKPGLLLEAARKYNIDLSLSWMIGDSNRDWLAGKAAGCRTMTVDEVHSIEQCVDDLMHTEGNCI